MRSSSERQVRAACMPWHGMTQKGPCCMHAMTWHGMTQTGPCCLHASRCARMSVQTPMAISLPSGHESGASSGHSSMGVVQAVPRGWCKQCHGGGTSSATGVVQAPLLQSPRRRSLEPRHGTSRSPRRSRGSGPWGWCKQVPGLRGCTAEWSARDTGPCQTRAWRGARGVRGVRGVRAQAQGLSGPAHPPPSGPTLSLTLANPRGAPARPSPSGPHPLPTAGP